MIDHAAITRGLFYGSLPDWQRGPVDAIIAEGARRGQSRARIAYVLATAYHETGRFRFLEEIRPKNPTAPYWREVEVASGVRKTFHGRGLVHLTWASNYAAMSIVTGENLVRHPERAKDLDIAVQIIWSGMLAGAFGRQLGVYINDSLTHFIGARRAVNGTDKADLVAGYAAKFLDALKAKP